jgi:hypothetical protein
MRASEVSLRVLIKPARLSSHKSYVVYAQSNGPLFFSTRGFTIARNAAWHWDTV